MLSRDPLLPWMCDLHIYGLLSECWSWSLSASCDTETLLQTPAVRPNSAEISCSNSAAAGGTNLVDVYSINYLKINFKVDHYLFLTQLTYSIICRPGQGDGKYLFSWWKSPQCWDSCYKIFCKWYKVKKARLFDMIMKYVWSVNTWEQANCQAQVQVQTPSPPN